jgi:endonuclease/exonuclease/phosphatase family metal-dependent hydrolase
MPSEVLRIAQLNVGSLLEPGWPERRHEVVAWLDRLEPDVVCLQEVWESASHDNTAAWIAAHLHGGPWHRTFGGHPLGGPLGVDPTLLFGSAVLSRWPIDDRHLYRLPMADDADPLAEAFPYELLHAATAGIDVFSTHLAAAPEWGHHRVRQVLAIDSHVREIRGSRDDAAPFGQRRRGLPAIVCGDFNAEPDSDEIRFLASLTALDGRTTFYQDAWRVAGDGPGHTQDWRGNPLAEALNVHRKRIDYVFVGDPFLRAGGAGRVLSAAVAFDAPLTGEVASDHAGLVVEVLWPDRPAEGGS